MKKLPKLIVIVGPTASGKTELGIFLAKKFGGEIVNADSRQIYLEMNIATAKPRLQKTSDRMESVVTVNGVRHYLFDIADPGQVVTAANWKQKALLAIRGILRRGKVPILVGGTGLYVRALVENWGIPEVPPNLKLRARLERELKKKGIKALWQQLVRLDPDAIAVVQPANPRRVIRALEVCLATDRPFTRQRTKGPSLFDVLEIGIDVPRPELYRRIDRRIDRQLRHGLIEETERLLKKYPRTLPAMSGIGYGEIADVIPDLIGDPGLPLTLIGGLDSRLRGNDKLVKEATQKIKFHTHEYARRQLSWFRRDPKIQWIKTKKQAVRLARGFLQ